MPRGRVADRADGNAHARCSEDVAIPEVDGGLHGLEQPLGHANGVAGMAQILEHDGELVSVQLRLHGVATAVVGDVAARRARDQVGAAELLFESPGNGHKELVAERPAVVVVDARELVDVEMDDREETRRSALPPGKGQRHAVCQDHPVRQGRQWIDDARLGDVGERAGDANGLAVLAVLCRSAREHAEVMTVAVSQSVLRSNASRSRRSRSRSMRSYETSSSVARARAPLPAVLTR